MPTNLRRVAEVRRNRFTDGEESLFEVEEFDVNHNGHSPLHSGRPQITPETIGDRCDFITASR